MALQRNHAANDAEGIVLRTARIHEASNSTHDAILLGKPIDRPLLGLGSKPFCLKVSKRC
jgi:hypothetical protein